MASAAGLVRDGAGDLEKTGAGAWRLGGVSDPAPTWLDLIGPAAD